MNPATEIRIATLDDAAALAVLLGELGYPTSAEQAATRLAGLQRTSCAVSYVATRAGSVCGLATVHSHASLNRDEPAVQLTLLVVAAQVRGSGAGKRLVQAAEEWARDHGAQRLVVSTAVHRAGAHAFYETLGYALTGRRYARVL